MEKLVEAGGLSIRVEVPPCVYPPEEDSETAVEALALLRDRGVQADSVLDIGTGTGILALASWLLWRPPILAATDISPFAVAAARRNLAGTGGLVARCFLASCFRPWWDVVVGNPPYLPVMDRFEDECRRFEALSWGWPGMVESFCLEAVRLARRGVVLVFSSLSGFNVLECLENHGFRIVGISDRRFFMERVMAVAAVRSGGLMRVGQA